MSQPIGALAALKFGGPAAGLVAHFESRGTTLLSQIEEAALTGPAKKRRRAGSQRGVARELRARYYPNLGIMLGTATREGIEALRVDPRVASVTGAPQLSLIQPKRKVKTALSEKLTWGLTAMKVPSLWSKGFSGKGMLIGHLDTGADGKHPALKGAIDHFAEFDDLGREVKPSPSAHDTQDHGTHTAATIAGRPVKGRSVGVAPGATLATAIVIEGGDVIARVLGGMEWVVGLGVRILSMSLGFRGWWDDFVPIVQILRQRGILPVMAVGNEGPGTSRSPGNYPDVLSVGAHDQSKLVARFSSSQKFPRAADPVVPDLLLPGVGVISAAPGGGWQSMDGTSMATPHMAGLAALLMEARPNATIDAIESAILRSCSLPSAIPAARGNRGIPDGLKALSFLP